MITAWRSQYWNDSILPVEFAFEYAHAYVDSQGHVFAKRSANDALCSSWEEAQKCLISHVEQKLRSLQEETNTVSKRMDQVIAMRPPEEGNS